jgi:hypothetical protein
MKPISISIFQKSFNLIFIFLTAAGLGYFLVNQFILNKPNTGLLIMMLALFVASIAAWQRKKHSK